MITPEDVKLIVTTDYSDEAIEFFITLAEAATAKCAVAWDEDLADQIITLVTAHFIEKAPGQTRSLASMSLGDASETYLQAALGEGLRGSTWGQLAQQLDPTGCLQRLGYPRATLEKI